MLYFSKSPVVLDSVEPEQYGKLKEFRAWAMTQGLVADYDSVDLFREELRRDLEFTLRDNPHLANEMASANEDADGAVSAATRRISLSADAAKMLKLAAGSRDGMIQMLRHASGAHISAGGTDMMTDSSDPREVARWADAIEQLENFGLIEATSYKRHSFQVTHSGYEAAAQVPDSLE